MVPSLENFFPVSNTEHNKYRAKLILYWESKDLSFFNSKKVNLLYVHKY